MTSQVSVGGFNSRVFSNGYRYLRPVVIRFDRVKGGSDLVRFPLLIKGVFPWLATAGVGAGKVTHPAGYDIRWEDNAGQRLDFELFDYNPATGQCVFWIKLSTMSATVDTALNLYYFNPNVASPEASAARTWGHTLLCLDTATGRDRSGLDHHFNTVNTTVGELHGPCAALNGTSAKLQTQSGLGWPGAILEVTVQAWCATTVAGGSQTLFWGGPETGPTDGSAGTFLKHNTPGRDGGAVATLAGKLRANGVDKRVEGGANLQDASDALQLLAMRGPASGLISMFAKGVMQTPSNTLTASVGPFNLNRGGRLFVGAASSIDFWTGRIGEVRILPYVESEGHLQTQLANGADPVTFYAVGGEVEAGAAYTAIVAFPGSFAAKDNVSIDLDVLTAVVGPPGLSLSLVGPTNVVGATVSIITSAGRTYARFKAPAGFQGKVRFPYTAGIGQRQSSSVVDVNVTLGTVIPPLVAVDDAFTVPPDSTSLLFVLANDSGGTPPYALSIITQPTLGTVELAADGTHLRYIGPDSP